MDMDKGEWRSHFKTIRKPSQILPILSLLAHRDRKEPLMGAEARKTWLSAAVRSVSLPDRLGTSSDTGELTREM